MKNAILPREVMIEVEPRCNFKCTCCFNQNSFAHNGRMKVKTLSTLYVKKIILGKSFSLDTNLTPTLIAEGEYRDLVRSIQVLRRENGFQIQDKINIIATQWPQDFENQILKKTLAESIKIGSELRIEKIN